MPYTESEAALARATAEEPMRSLDSFTHVGPFAEAQDRLDEWTTTDRSTFDANLEQVSLAEARRMILTSEELAREHRARANRIDGFVESVRERLHVLANASTSPEVEIVAERRFG